MALLAGKDLNMVIKTKLRAFALGSSVGAVLSIAIFTSGMLNIWITPLWQEVLFLPGFVSGFAFYDCCDSWFSGYMGDYPVLVVGIITVSITYGIVAVGLLAVVRLVLRKRRLEM